jgi:hypothetical protein
MTQVPIKLLKDKTQRPFIPYVPAEAITINGTNYMIGEPEGLLELLKVVPNYNASKEQLFEQNSGALRWIDKPVIPTKTSQLTNDSNFVADANYVHTDNNYTTTEKNKLSGIATGAEVNVQADWNEADTSSDAYIKNKPVIPVFTQTQSDWNEADTSDPAYIKNKPSIPTNISDLNNDSTFEDATNKVTTISNASTDTEYPSAKGVYDYIYNYAPPAYLGSITDYNTQAKALDITDLKPGLYLLYGDYYNAGESLYVKFKYNGSYVVGHKTFTQNYFLNHQLCLKINDNSSSAIDDVLGTISYSEVTDGGSSNATTIPLTLKATTISFTGATDQGFNAVKLDDTQTITGVKTFNALPRSAVAPVINDELTNKAYVDSVAGGGATDAVHYLYAKGDHATVDTAINIDELNTGELYVVGGVHQGNASSMYFKATVNGVVSTTTINIYDCHDYTIPIRMRKYGEPVAGQSASSPFFEVLLVTDSTASGQWQYKSYQFGVYSNGNIYTSTGSSGMWTYKYSLLDKAQTVSGRKIFTTLPESSIVPTTDDQLVNKKYVDDNAGGNITHTEEVMSDINTYVFSYSAFYNNSGSPTSFINYNNTNCNSFIYNEFSKIFRQILNEILATGKQNEYNYLVIFITVQNSNGKHTFKYRGSSFKNNWPTSASDWSYVEEINTKSSIHGYFRLSSITYDSEHVITNLTISNISESGVNYLSTGNTFAFTPTADYQPATKKYVDDTVGGGGSSDPSFLPLEVTIEERVSGLTLTDVFWYWASTTDAQIKDILNVIVKGQQCYGYQVTDQQSWKVTSIYSLTKTEETSEYVRFSLDNVQPYIPLRSFAGYAGNFKPMCKLNYPNIYVKKSEWDNEEILDVYNNSACTTHEGTSNFTRFSYNNVIGATTLFDPWAFIQNSTNYIAGQNQYLARNANAGNLVWKEDSNVSVVLLSDVYYEIGDNRGYLSDIYMTPSATSHTEWAKIANNLANGNSCFAVISRDNNTGIGPTSSYTFSSHLLFDAYVAEVTTDYVKILLRSINNPSTYYPSKTYGVQFRLGVYFDLQFYVKRSQWDNKNITEAYKNTGCTQVPANGEMYLWSFRSWQHQITYLDTNQTQVMTYDRATTYTGYDSTKNQYLTHDTNNTFKWVDM